jgi:RNA polymerase sigma factor (sigma-70 family)
MGDVHRVSVGSSLRILFEDGTVTGLTDAQLLDLFVGRRDEAAFTALLERHGPMVQRVCHEVLRDHHDAEDAFQATFLVLARHAGSVRQRDVLASWLYGVALRVAAGARSVSARRRVHEHNYAAQRAAGAGRGNETHPESEQELGALLHGEIGRLPERFRAAVVLCYLEGRTYEEAARVLRCPVGTIKSRLATARERLGRRLGHLNLAFPIESVGLSLQGNPPISKLPTPLPQPTLQAVIRHATGGVAPVSIEQLTEGVLNSMLWHRLMQRLFAAGMILISSAAMATGAIGLARMNDTLSADGERETIVSAAGVAQPPPTRLEDRGSERRVPVRNGLPITLTGRIVDERGVPVAGADLRFRLFRSKIPILRIASELVDVWEAKTDTDGRYQIAGVRGIEGSEYQHLAMDVNAPGFVEFIEFYFAGFGQVAKSRGVVSDVQLERGDVVTGRCVGHDGKSESGAKIRAAFAGKPMSSLGRARTTDAEGRFRLAIPHGLAAELIIYPERRAPRADRVHTKQRVSRRVSVAAGGGELGEIPLEEGEEHAGVFHCMLREGERDPSLFLRVPGGWVPNGQVIAFESTDRGEFGWFPMTLACKTDRDGEFRVPPLKGPFKVWAAHAHDSGPDDRGPIVSDTPPLACMPQVAEFQPHSARGLHLGGYRPVAIQGKVTGPDGKPAQGVALMFMAATGDAEEKRLTVLQWTSTNAEGQYALTGIPQGLTRAYLNTYAEPPDRQSHFEATASGNFQGTAVISSVSFDPLKRDQDPLDFRLKLVTPEPPAPPKVEGADVRRQRHPGLLDH